MRAHALARLYPYLKPRAIDSLRMADYSATVIEDLKKNSASLKLLFYSSKIRLEMDTTIDSTELRYSIASEKITINWIWCVHNQILYCWGSYTKLLWLWHLPHWICNGNLVMKCRWAAEDLFDENQRPHLNHVYWMGRWGIFLTCKKRSSLLSHCLFLQFSSCWW